MEPFAGAPPVGPGAWSRLLKLMRRAGSRHGHSAEPQLRAAAAALDRVCGASETDFMHLGERLAAFSRQARSIQARGGQAADVLSGGEIVANLAQVDRVLRQVQAQLADGDRQIEQVRATLGDASAAFHRADAPLRAIGMAIQSLRMLTTTTRTESARLDHSGVGFEHLTVQVTQFGSAIATRLEALRGDLGRQGGRLAQAERRITRYRDAQSQALDRVVAGVQDVVRRLERKRAAQSEVVTRVGERHREIVSAVGTVVASLQYQDITRQQLEHVRNALHGLREQPAGHGLPGLCSLQGHQLVTARDNLIAALDEAYAGLGEVSERVAAMVRSLDALGGDADERFADLVAALRRGFHQATAALEAHAGMMAEVQALVSELSTALGEMARASAGVEGIGYEIRLIALNTAIKAAALGERGAALDMVAHLVGQLSEAVMEQTGAFRRTLADLGRQADLLETHMRQDAAQAERLRTARQELEAALTGIDGLIGQAMDELGEMEQAGRQLAEDVAVLLGAADTAGRVRGEVDGVLERLRTVAGAESVPALLELRDGAVGTALGTLSAGYTTRGQRDTHAAWLGMTEPATDQAHAEAAPAARKRDAAALGDNVELF